MDTPIKKEEIKQDPIVAPVGEKKTVDVLEKPATSGMPLKQPITPNQVVPEVVK